MILPQGFKARMEGLLGNSAEDFFRSMEEGPAVSLKLNRRKTSAGVPAGEPVAWCSSGVYLEDRPQFTLDPLMHAGAYYVQDASSMIYETLAAELLNRGLLEAPGSGPLTVADLCAAPGGKTTSLINALPDGSVVLANEYNAQRANVLAENLAKWGYPHTVVTNASTSALAAATGGFDLVCVDAPCSGEGMMRKEEVARSQWTEGLVEQCAALQRDILADAVSMLRPGGIMIYSTCTFNPEENECNVAWLSERYGLEPVDMGLPQSWGIGRALEGETPALRFMPHLTRGEGLFAAVLRRPGDASESSAPRMDTGRSRGGKNKANRGREAAPEEARQWVGDATLTELRAVGPGWSVMSAATERLLSQLGSGVRVLSAGVAAAVAKGKGFMPAPQLALSTAYRREAFAQAELNREAALDYLRHLAVALPAGTERGPVAVTYNELPLGFVNNIGNRANNLYPPEWRIRNL